MAEQQTHIPSSITKLPPQNIEAEMSCLGAIMLNKDAILRVVDLLEPRDFYQNIHSTIYETMEELFQKGTPIDLLSMTTRLKRKSLFGRRTTWQLQRQSSGKSETRRGA